MRFVALAVVVACAEAPKPVVVAPVEPAKPVVVEAAKPPARLWTDEEGRQLAEKALARIAQNATLACPAPVVGKAVDGASTDEVLALMTPSTPCLKQLAEPDSVDDAFDKKCGNAITAAVRHAAAYRSGCSPFVIGVRATPGMLLPVFNLARLLAVHARSVKDVPTLLAGIRVMQDLARGPSSMLLEMTSDGAIGILAKRLDELVETAKFAKAEVTATTKTLSDLVSGAPSLGDSIAGEHEWAAIVIALPLLEPAGWKPPGGGAPMGTLMPPGRDPRDVGIGMLFGIMKVADEDARACPSGAPVATCRDALVFAPAKPGDDPWQLGDRDQIVDAIAASMHPMAHYIERHEETYTTLTTIGSKLGLKGL